MHPEALTEAAARVAARLDALAGCTDTPGEITRLFLSPAHRRSLALLKAWMTEARLATRLDASGTLVATRAGADAEWPTLLLGSHIDTVRDAGKYDGCLGIVLAIEAAAALGGEALPYGLQIRAFGDEEGVRFPVTLTTAHATAGTFDRTWLDVRDEAGVTLRQALSDFGLDSDQADACAAAGAAAYLEVHIEQGPVLEHAGAPLGIVTAIAAAARFVVQVNGRAGHAGTVPMDRRQDALAAACAMILALRNIARDAGDVVATTGSIAVEPGAPNTIPALCRFTIDLRAPQDAALAAAEAGVRRALAGVAEAERVTLDISRTHAAPATACATQLQSLLAGAVAACGLPAPALGSGAGHDGMAIAGLCPIGMLFVRCAGGVSHSPAERVAQEDIAVALQALLHALRAFRPDIMRDA